MSPRAARTPALRCSAMVRGFPRGGRSRSTEPAAVPVADRVESVRRSVDDDDLADRRIVVDDERGERLVDPHVCLVDDDDRHGVADGVREMPVLNHGRLLRIGYVTEEPLRHRTGATACVPAGRL